MTSRASRVTPAEESRTAEDTSATTSMSRASRVTPVTSRSVTEGVSEPSQEAPDQSEELLARKRERYLSRIVERLREDYKLHVGMSLETGNGSLLELAAGLAGIAEKDRGAGLTIGQGIEEVSRIWVEYLTDLDPYLEENKHAPGLLPKRINKYRQPRT